MTLRRQNTIAACERRTQGARMAALFVRRRTHYRAGQRVLMAEASLFNSLAAPQNDKAHVRSPGRGPSPQG